MGLFTDGFKLLKKASEPLYKTPKSIQEAILKEGSIIGIIEIPGIDIRYPVMEETGSEMLNAGTGNNAFYCQVQI